MKLLLIAGARPNFMKIAPIIRAIKSFNQTNQRNKINQTDQRNYRNLTKQRIECIGQRPKNSDTALR